MSDAFLSVKAASVDATVSNGVAPNDTVAAGASANYNLTQFGPLTVSGTGAKVTLTAGTVGGYLGSTYVSPNQSKSTILMSDIIAKTAAGSGSGGGSGGQPTQPPKKS